MITLKKASQATLIASSLAFVFGTAHAQVTVDNNQPAQMGATETTEQPAQNNAVTSSQMGQQSSGQDAAEGSTASGGMHSGGALQSGGPMHSGGAMQSGGPMHSGGATQSSGAVQSNQPDTASQGATGTTSGAGQNQAAQQGGANQKKADAAVVYMMVPVEVVSANDAMRRGCWAKLYDSQNYAGEALTLVGPTAIADMSGPFGINWDDRVRSIELGSKAMLTVFDDDEYEDRVAQFQPGQRVADVSKRLGFFDEFGSVRVECNQR